MSIYCDPYLQQIKLLSNQKKYTNWYISICKNASIRGNNRKEVVVKMGYIESHHIVPHSFGLIPCDLPHA